MLDDDLVPVAMLSASPLEILAETPGRRSSSVRWDLIFGASFL